MSASRALRQTGLFICGFLLIVSLLGTWNLIGSQALAAARPRQVEPGPESVVATQPSAPSETASQIESQDQKPLSGDGFYASEAIEDAFPKHRMRDNNIAVITENDPAKVPNLVPVMLHFASVLGPDWPIVLLTLEQNWVVPESPEFRQHMAAKRIFVMFLPPGTAFPDHYSVTVFLTGRWIWELLAPANRVLIFQVDSILCAQAPKKVEDYLEWEFIGAPINDEEHGQGFNGGLSIRDPKLMLEIVKTQERSPTHINVEDQWFYHRARERGAHLPSIDVAKTFVAETIFYDNPLGYHQPFRWYKDDLERIRQSCPEIDLLQGGSHFF